MRLLLIVGCPIEYTPVVKAYIEYLSEARCAFDVIEYRHRNRFGLLRDVARQLRKFRYDRLVLVNVQALLFGLLAWLPSLRSVVYWKLESGRAFESFSLAGILPALEWIVPRKRVALVVPSHHRREVQAPAFRRVDVIPNAPLRPYLSRESVRSENARGGSPSGSLIMYGNLSRDPDGMYVEEWRDFASRSDLFQIDFLGGVKSHNVASHNVRELPKIPHPRLIEVLLSSRYKYSVIGYRPVGVNTKLAAPNRLIESLACGVPVVVHSGNPYLVDMVRAYDCGFVMNFDSLDLYALEGGLRDWERHVCGARKAAIALSLVTTLKGTSLEWDPHG